MARYRYRFQTIPLSTLGSGRRQINTKGCWRVQFTLNGGQVPFLINGVSPYGETADALNGEQVGFIEYTVGGVIINGEPVYVEQDTIITGALNTPAQGWVVLEWLDPIQ